MSYNPIKRRAPYITRTDSNKSDKKPHGRTSVCPYCGSISYYWEAQQGYYCNACSTLEEETDEMKARFEAQKLQQEATFEMADGSAIYSPCVYTPSNIRTGKTIGIGGGGGGHGRRTIIPVGRKDAVIDKLRRSRQGLTPEMDRIFKAQDEQLTSSSGRTITEDRLELKRSDKITSSDDLKAEKTGSVGLKGAGEYNPATVRRTRLSF